MRRIERVSVLRSQAARDTATALLLLVAGQLALIALGPLTRVADPLGGAAGPALLAPDSEGYLRASTSLDGVLDATWTRRTYLLLLWVGHRLGDAPSFAVAVQVLAAVVAGCLLVDLGRRAYGPGPGSSWIGALSAAVLLVNPMTSQWLRFVLTETLFYALVVVALWAGERTRRLPGDRSGPLLLVGIGLVAAFTRPNGVMLTGAVLTLLAVTRLRPPARVAAIVIAWAAVAGLLVLGLSATGQPTEASMTEQVHAGVVVEGAEHVRVTIPMPPADDPTDRSDAAGIRYVAAHPVAFARLAVTRMVVEVVQVRRHYPPVVNVAMALAMVAYFVSAAIGLRDRRAASLRVPTLAIAVPLLAIVGATFAVPEGRYGWASLLTLAPTAAVGFGWTVVRLRRRQGARVPAPRGRRAA